MMVTQKPKVSRSPDYPSHSAAHVSNNYYYNSRECRRMNDKCSGDLVKSLQIQKNKSQTVLQYDMKYSSFILFCFYYQMLNSNFYCTIFVSSTSTCQHVQLSFIAYTPLFLTRRNIRQHKYTDKQTETDRIHRNKDQVDRQTRTTVNNDSKLTYDTIKSPNPSSVN